MPRKKKPVRELTTEEAIRSLFPEKVVAHADEIVTKTRKAPGPSHRRSRESLPGSSVQR